MKRALIILLALACGCSRPKAIPEGDLEKIFSEIYLANAYVGRESINTDSLDIYTPIFKKYGYKPRDMAYTISEFSRRKSSRLSEVVAAASRAIDRQYKVYADRVAVLDTVDRRSRELFRNTVLSDSLIRATRIADTARLRILVPARAGEYTISYYYKVDTLDKNGSLRSSVNLIDTAGRRTSPKVNWMRSNERERYSVSLEVEPSTRDLELLFGNYRKEMTPPRLTIDSLVVSWVPPVKEALEGMTRILFDYKYRIDGKEYNTLALDSSALDIHPPRLAEGVRGED